MEQTCVRVNTDVPLMRQSDTGVPGIPPFSWVFNPSNKYLNDNKYMDRFGRMGFRCFDVYRKRYMG